jgi:integrase
MPKVTLTEITLRSLKPSERQTDYWDASMPNFGVRVGLTHKTFIVMTPGRSRVALGRTSTISLAQARQMARERLYAPRATPEPDQPSTTFSEALELFLSTHSKQKHSPRTAHEHKRVLTKHFLPKFKTRELCSINAGEIAKIIDGLHQTPSEMEHCFRMLRTFLNFCVKRSYLGSSPISKMEPPPKGRSRERFLSPEELAKVWHQAVAIGYPYGTIVQLLILGGQRAGQTAALRWDWIDEESISYPASVTKNSRASRIPYGPLTKSVLATVPRTGALLFPARGYTDKPFVGFGASKILLDKCGVENFTHHDLRRSYSTIMASPVVGAPIHVLEKLLGHSAGVLRGVAEIYNRYSYWDEMKAAVTAYEEFIQRVIIDA